MRNTFIITALSLLTACSYDPNSGGSPEFNTQFLSRPSWEIAEQNANGPVRFCRVVAGDVQVALKTDGHALRQQVAPTFKLRPGDTYSVHIGSHKYDTVQDWFGDEDSNAMIQDFLSYQGNVYTELMKINAANHDMQHNNQSNKIPLAGFAGQYQACKNYVQTAH